MKGIITVGFAFFMSGCAVFVPEFSAEQSEDYYRCDLISKSMTLRAERTEPIRIPKNCNEECAIVYLAAAAAVPVGSFIISGSIVAVGNTLHWVEQQGRCEDSATKRAIEALKSGGGNVIESADDMLQWIKKQMPGLSDEQAAAMIPPKLAAALVRRNNA